MFAELCGPDGLSGNVANVRGPAGGPLPICRLLVVVV